jgi:hypothetical protein
MIARSFLAPALIIASVVSGCDNAGTTTPAPPVTNTAPPTPPPGSNPKKLEGTQPRQSTQQKLLSN